MHPKTNIHFVIGVHKKNDNWEFNFMTLENVNKLVMK